MKMYVLVRNDLSNSQKAVQAGHALAEYLIRYPTTEWGNGTLIYLKVRNESTLKVWVDKLEKDNKTYSKFYEPDIGNQLTAVAVVADRDYFPCIKLL